MPAEEEKQGSLRALRDGIPAPNGAHAAPRRANMIGRADPLWARFAAGALTFTLTTTSAAVPPTDAFLNSTSRINNGVTMPATQLEAPQGLRASADDLSRLSSDANVSRIVQSGHQDLLLQRVNDLLAALEGTGQPYRREVMLGGVRDQQAWAEKYSSLTDGQKQAFRDQAILMMAQNFGDRFAAGQQGRIEDFGSVVRQNLDSLFMHATTAPAEAHAEAPAVPWYQQIPVIREITSLLAGPQAVPAPTEAPVEFSLEGLQARVEELGVDFSDIAPEELTLEQSLALMFYERAYTFFSTTPNPTPEQILNFYETILVAGRTLARQEGRDITDLHDVDLLLMAGTAQAGDLLNRVLARITAAETERVQKVAQNIYEYFRSEELQRLQRAQPAGAGTVLNAEGRAPQALSQEQINAQAENLAREKAEAFFDKIKNPQSRGSLDIRGVLREMGVPEDLITRADSPFFLVGRGRPYLNPEQLNGIIRNPAFGDVNAVQMFVDENMARVVLVRGQFASGFDEAFIAPWRMVSEAWRGEASAMAKLASSVGSAFAALSYRVPFRSFRVIASSGRTVGERAGAAVGLVPYALAAWQIASWFEGITGYGPDHGPFTFCKYFTESSSGREATGATGTPVPPTELSRGMQEKGRAAQELVKVADELGNTTYRNLRDQLARYRQYVLGTTSTNFSAAATLERINLERLRRGMQFLANFESSTRGMSGQDAELEFYRQFFRSIAPANARGETVSMLVNIIDTYIPQTDRAALYKELFLNVALRNTERPVTDEAQLFSGIYKQSERLRNLLAPILAVVDAKFGLGSAHENPNINPQVAATYLSQLNLTVALRGVYQLQQGPEPLDNEDVAFWLARSYMAINPNLIRLVEGYTNEQGQRVPGFFSDAGTQLEAYKKALEYIAGHPNAGQDEVLNNALLSLLPVNRRSAAMQLLQASQTAIEASAAAQAQARENARSILLERERGQELLDFVDASLADNSDRLNAYNSLIQYLSNPDFASAGYAELKEYFISSQLGAYPALRSAVEAFFTGQERDSALSYLIGLTKEALRGPGVRTRSYTYAAPGTGTRITMAVAEESEVGNLLVRKLVSENLGLRNDLDALYIGEPERRRGAFDANRFLMLLDAALFLKDNPGATSDQLHQHFISRFNDICPGLDMGTVLSGRQFDLVLALLPMRDNSGALLSEDALLGIANSPPYWEYRTADWLRGQYEALNPTEKARMFYFLPEDMQKEYWNEMGRRERDSVWRARAPSGDTTGLGARIRAWQTNHAFLKARRGYQRWE